MQRKRLKTLIIIAMAVIAVAVTSIGVISATRPTVLAQSIEINNVLDSRIALNTELEVAPSTSVEFNGTHTADNGVVVFPDGKIVKAGKIKFNQTGTYQLRYYFEYAGVTHTAFQNVEVYTSYFNLSNPVGGDITVSDEENKLNCGKDGVIVNLKSGTTFVYNKVLDLRNVGEDGLANIIELDCRYGHYEGNTYVRDVTEAWVRLTDCYNPNVYIELRMQNSDLYNGALYPGVKTNSQNVTGMDKGETHDYGGAARIITLDGIIYRVWSGNGSMNVGLYNMKTALTTGAIWKFDPKTQRVYLTYNDKDNFLVTDLDEPIIYNNGNLFAGFTTGEVYVSIYANGYAASNARTEIISIGNDNLKEVISQQYVDEVAPAITVNAKKTTQTGVYGAVGDTFEIPSATAMDVNLIGGIDVAVYRGYGTNMQSNVSVIDNKISLAEKDLYTIVYSATDKSGNVGKETFTVSTVETPDNRAITLDTLQDQTVAAGTLLDNLYDVINSINVDGETVEVDITVTSEKQNLTGKGRDFSFIPYYEGKYTVKYSYSDGIFNYEKVVNLQCEASSNVCFLDEFVAPKYYLKGANYAIDDIRAYTFTSGKPERVETEVYAVFDDGQEQRINSTSQVEITGDSNVYFVYKAANATPYVTDKISIINADYQNAAGRKLGFDMSKFFIGDFTANALGATGSRTRNITFTSNKTVGNNKLSYFNRISGRRFALEYKVVANEDKFARLKITLTDAFNIENKLTVEIYNNPDATYYSINGGALQKAGNVEFADRIFNVSYDYDSKFVRIGEFSDIVDFNASLVYLDVELMGITGKSSIIISKVGNANVAGNTYKDNVEPEIYVYDFQGDYSEGDKVKISIPEFSDVFSGVDYSKASLIISCSDGKPVLDASGKPLGNVVCGNEYEILLDRIAKFFVVYKIYDFSGNEATKSITVNCADSTAPTVTLGNISESKTITVKAGAEILFEFSVSDNVTSPKNIITYIHLYCDDMFSYVPNVSNIKQVDAPEDGKYSEKFAIPVRGRYTAQIHAIDQEGNLCVKYINIVVE